MASFACDICGLCYAKKVSLNRHLSKIHHVVPDGNFNSKCLDCKVSFPHVAQLRKHLQSVHNKQMEEEKLEFLTEEEFRSWINSFPENAKCEYITTATRTRQNILDKEVVERRYFNCSRSFNRDKVNTLVARQRAMKTQGSKKLNHTCTSQIIVTKRSSGKLNVIYYKTHYGHEMEIKHINLSKDIRKDVATKLASGITVTRILDQRRDAIEGDLRRSYLMTRTDVMNIGASFNIDFGTGIRHQNDVISVDMFVDKCQREQLNPVLLYKKQGEPHNILNFDDFVIIIMNNTQKELLKKLGNNILCIDSTHGMNSYDFEMTTLMVRDEFGEGFPVCYMFSNRKDTIIFELFFNAVRTEVGDIECSIFMSDITNVFYNAWSTVMGVAKQQLFCSWHIDRAWRKNLTKISNSERRDEVYKMLKFLQQNTNMEEFHIQLNNFITMLEEDVELRNYGSYFKNNYQHNFSKWAYCYRAGSGINTNMQVENLHKVVKHQYLDGKKTKRLDKSINAVMKYTRDKVVDRIIKLTKGKNTVRTKEIKERHRRALDESLTCTRNEDDTSISWTVNQNDSSFQVTQANEDTHDCCPLKCLECNVCLNCYACSCMDYYLKFTICKHIHYIATKYGKKGNTATTSTHAETQNLLINLSKEQAPGEENRFNLISLKAEITALLNECRDDLNNEIITQVSSLVKKARTLLASNFKCEKEADGKIEPSNKNIEKQIRFVSTQKKRAEKRKLRLNKPNDMEKKIISETLRDQEVQIISTSYMNDHAYARNSQSQL